MKAVWKDTLIAQSDDTIEVEGNQYFPPQDVNMEYLEVNNEEEYTCPWKGETQYYDVVVEGNRNSAAAWGYPDPKPEAKKIKDYKAFWRGVEVKE
ncbi:MAG: DUF427 domain-containing protein [Elusimicrobiota bacterium]